MTFRRYLNTQLRRRYWVSGYCRVAPAEWEVRDDRYRTCQRAPGVLHAHRSMPPLRGRRDDRQPRFRPCPQPIRINCGDVAPQPHSRRCSSTSTPTEHALNLSAPSSRSFVLAALRALHLDTGVGSALSTSRSKQLKKLLDSAPPLQGSLFLQWFDAHKP